MTYSKQLLKVPLLTFMIIFLLLARWGRTVNTATIFSGSSNWLLWSTLNNNNNYKHIYLFLHSFIPFVDERKTLIPCLWLLYDFLSSKNYVNVTLKSTSKKNLHFFSCHLEGHWRKYQDLDPDPLVTGTDLDPYQNVTDPQHCKQLPYGIQKIK